MPIYLLVTLTVFLLGLVSVLVTKALPTLPHLRSIISDKAFIALLSLG
ncbi:hypothetical protein [uncultured Tateyamaria sp.]|nr:hypothetical protein [uncultured Tateyamaria sp.]